MPRKQLASSPPITGYRQTGRAKAAWGWKFSIQRFVTTLTAAHGVWSGRRSASRRKAAYWFLNKVQAAAIEVTTASARAVKNRISSQFMRLPRECSRGVHDTPRVLLHMRAPHSAYRVSDRIPRGRVYNEIGRHPTIDAIVAPTLE
jgi:hypothetical protein